ncbi:transposase DNA-binding-containing protein [Paraburkholderia caledonica]|uniref:IS4/Tn5 family transposase DNA-binding protein n=1 Tax=Paraburkholderia caledonica TaxID=134536 RepID=UPI0038B991FE
MAKRERTDERAWFEKEIEASKFQDARLRKRFGMVLERLWSGIGQTIPFACQDWSSTKAAYRFLSNERVSEQDILSGHFHASAERFRSTQGPILILQDTTTFSYQRVLEFRIGGSGRNLGEATLV